MGGVTVVLLRTNSIMFDVRCALHTYARLGLALLLFGLESHAMILMATFCVGHFLVQATCCYTAHAVDKQQDAHNPM